MVDVEELYLCETFLRTTEVSGNHSARHAQIVFLPRLRRLILKSNPYTATVHVLKSLSLPGLTSLSLFIDITSQDPQGIVAALPQDRSSIFPMLKEITSIQVSAQDEDKHYSFCATNVAKSHCVDVELGTAFDMIDVWPYSLPLVLAEFVEVFSSSPITSFAVSGEYSRVPVSQWVDVFDHFSHLETIDLDLNGCESDSAHTFRVALSQKPSPPSRGAVYCPRLKVVKTAGAHCIPSMGEDAFWAMPRALHALKERGYRVEILHLSLAYEEETIAFV